MICLKKGLLFLPLVFGSSTAPPTDAETMLVDFVHFFKAPLKIPIFVCWTNGEYFTCKNLISNFRMMKDKNYQKSQQTLFGV